MAPTCDPKQICFCHLGGGIWNGVITWENLGSSGIIRGDHLGSSGILWDHLGSFGISWHHLKGLWEGLEEVSGRPLGRLWEVSGKVSEALAAMRSAGAPARSLGGSLGSLRRSLEEFRRLFNCGLPRVFWGALEAIIVIPLS